MMVYADLFERADYIAERHAAKGWFGARSVGFLCNKIRLRSEIYDALNDERRFYERELATLKAKQAQEIGNV